MAPTDREIKNEAKKRGIQVRTRKQAVYALNSNDHGTEATCMTTIQDLDDFMDYQYGNKAGLDTEGYDAEKQNQMMDTVPSCNTPLPMLQRKPMTPLFTENRNKKRGLELSPIDEQSQTNEVIVERIVQGLVPALLKAINQGNQQTSDFRSESNENIT